MDNPIGDAWQHRLLSASELTAYLETISTDAALAVLQRQLELQSEEAAALKPVTPEPESIRFVAPAPSLVTPEPVLAVPAEPALTPSEPVVAPSEPEPAFLNPDLPLFERNVVPAELRPATDPIRVVEPVVPVAETPAAPVVQPTGEAPQPTPTVPNFSFPWDNTGSTPVAEAPKDPAPVAETPASSSALDDAKRSIWDDTASTPAILSVPTITPAEPMAVVPEHVPEPMEPVTPVASFAPNTEAQPVESPISEPVEISSAEDAVTEFEEDHRVAAEPNFVDDVILGVGGTDDEPEAQASASQFSIAGYQPYALPHVSDPAKRRPASSLLATWNGSGALLGLAIIGYLAASQKTDFTTLAIAAFAALVLAGIGFAVAALAARRGSSPQQVLSRAAFGVYGNVAPSIFMVLARLAATAVVTLVAAMGVLQLIPSIPTDLSVQLGASPFTFSSGYLVVLALLALGTGVSAVAGRARFILNIVFAAISVAFAASTVVLSVLQDPTRFAIGSSANFISALSITTLILVTLGLLWGSAAVDENLELKRGTMGAKILTAGIFNWIFIGGLALVSGFAFESLVTLPVVRIGLIAVLVILMVAMLAHLVARDAAALEGLGMRRINLGSHLMVLLVLIVASVGLMYRLGASGVWLNLFGYLPVIGVPVLAWLSIFGVDTLLRRVDYHDVSLVRSYGFYGKVNWFNLAGWLIATALGWGLLKSSLPEFFWLGYLVSPLQLDSSPLVGVLGLWVAMAIGGLVPLIFTIPRIRNQENETLAMEARRTELADVQNDIQ